MKKWMILFLFLISNFLWAEGVADFFDIQATKEHVLDKRQNYFLTSTDYKITPKVNPITGEYKDEPGKPLQGPPIEVHRESYEEAVCILNQQSP